MRQIILTSVVLGLFFFCGCGSPEPDERAFAKEEPAEELPAGEEAVDEDRDKIRNLSEEVEIAKKKYQKAADEFRG